MEELKKLISAIISLALSVWLLGAVIANPTLAASIALKVFVGCIVILLGICLYDAIK